MLYEVLSMWLTAVCMAGYYTGCNFIVVWKWGETMFRKLIGVTVAFLLCLIPVVAAASSVNLVDGATVSLIGDFSGSKTTYINDGLVEDGTRWSRNSVWWKGTGAAIEISLNGQQIISSISIQADSNDEYRVDYWDSVSGSWQLAFSAEVTKTAENDWLSGLDLRESASGLGIVTDRLRIAAVSGDNLYSVSEVQAFGTPTPVPPAIFVLGCGLGGLAYIRRKYC
ncbi:hypothetical protein [Maridesulfovibrio sp. FT414]|uniref:hypothetical protein n=1 Tax=Maridesulfovibrio sp. FT414 TaxID=2979469 RepID=UPI003D8071C3